MALVADLVGALSALLAGRFTTTSFILVSNIYGLVQCSPYQTLEACKGCLDWFRNAMPAMFDDTAGAHAGQRVVVQPQIREIPHL